KDREFRRLGQVGEKRATAPPGGAGPRRALIQGSAGSEQRRSLGRVLIMPASGLGGRRTGRGASQHIGDVGPANADIGERPVVKGGQLGESLLPAAPLAILLAQGMH